ncbi:MAG: BspA family leucine-rich repeat surface protein, partial [Hyphomicrobiales bacterium]
MKKLIFTLAVILLSTAINSNINAQSNEQDKTSFIIKVNGQMEVGRNIESWPIVITTQPEETYLFDIDWDNDGVFDEKNITERSEDGYVGPRVIRIRGKYPQMGPSASSDEQDDTNPHCSVYGYVMHEILQWGNIEWTSLKEAFRSYGHNRSDTLIISATDAPDLSKVEDMSCMFGEFNNLKVNVSDWDVSNVTNMSNLFAGSQIIYSLEEPQVLGVSDWDVSKVKNMSKMFHSVSNFNDDISNWDVSSVRDMYAMFGGDTIFNSDISNWDVAKVTDMSAMFYKAKAFNSDISDWDVAKVTDMSYMFSGATNFNGDISSWNVSNVTNMCGMFYKAEAFNSDISGWDVSKVTDMEDMFKGTAMNTENYNKLLIEWSKQKVQTGVAFHAGSSTYDSEEAKEAKQKLIEEHGWFIIDAGMKDNSAPIAKNIEMDNLKSSNAYTIKYSDLSYSDSDNDKLEFIRISKPYNYAKGRLFIDENNDTILNLNESISLPAIVHLSDIESGKLKYLSPSSLSENEFHFHVYDGHVFSKAYNMIFTVEIIDGLEETPNSLNFTLSPNPTTSSFSINCADISNETMLQVMNVSGEVLYTAKVSA